MGKHSGTSDELVLKTLKQSRRGPLKTKEVARALEIPTGKYRALQEQLDRLADAGRVYRVKGRRYALPKKINLVVGRLSIVRSGDGFVIPTDGSGDVFVPSAGLDSAMDGDEVVARLEGGSRGPNRAGRVIKVLERAHQTVVGAFRRTGRFGVVHPADRRVGRPILIPEGEHLGAVEGDQVVARITTFGSGRVNPMGTVERILGQLGAPGVDVLTVIYGHELPTDFPPEVETAAQRVQGGSPDDLSGREDLRDLLVFTIDPPDAKDHDDALSVVDLGGGRYQVGIHIADVSHFVTPGSPLDVEALARGTSVYLVDRVIPMLPEALSSRACSLVPGEDRFTLSLLLEIDEQGTVHHHRLVRAVIRSRHRLHYRQAQQILDNVEEIDSDTRSALGRLATLAGAIRESRRERGSLDFDLPESRVVLDDDGEPIDIQRIERMQSHRLIEDFMILANEVIAEQAAENHLPFIYRVHEGPSPGKRRDLLDLLRSLGHNLSDKKTWRPSQLQRILKAAVGTPSETLVSTAILRAMQRARYSTTNLGHFGLASECYAHFTSPIRRYPDLVTHRILARALIDQATIPDAWTDSLEVTADRSSDREQVATRAERESIDLKKAEFMERHLGDEFCGSISGVTAFGFFVLLDDFFVEGLVHVNTLGDGYYEFRPEQYCLARSKGGARFRLGDRVMIRVARVNREERKIDFEWLSGP